MAWRLEDRWLWLGLGVFALLALKGVSYGLRDIKRLTEIHETEPKKEQCAISQETEDALNSDSLAVLAQSDDWDTKEQAMRILADRFLRDQNAVTDFARDIFSPHEEVRAQAIVVRNFLERYGADINLANIHFVYPSAVLVNPSARGEFVAHQARDREESFEEQEVRRRRREAVVVHTGSGPISADDIIQRGGRVGIPSGHARAMLEMADRLDLPDLVR